MQSFIGKRSLLWIAGVFLAIVVTACGMTATTYTLTVSTSGNGSGSITSTPEGIDTAAEDPSTAQFDAGTMVTLTATYDEMSNIFTWGGACAGASGDTCEVEMTQDLDVSVTFEAAAPASFSAPIADGFDDAEEFLSDSTSNPGSFPAGFTYTSSSDLELAFDPDHSLQLVGLRFQNVTVPANAVVRSAAITFTAAGASSGDVTVTIQGQKLANPPAFNNDTAGNHTSNISPRSRTAASADWTITGAWAEGETHASADLSGVVQEIIELNDWAPSNAMVFIVSGSDQVDFRRAHSYDGNAALAASLEINYVVPTP